MAISQAMTVKALRALCVQLGVLPTIGMTISRGVGQWLVRRRRGVSWLSRRPGVAGRSSPIVSGVGQGFDELRSGARLVPEGGRTITGARIGRCWLLGVDDSDELALPQGGSEPFEWVR